MYRNVSRKALWCALIMMSLSLIACQKSSSSSSSGSGRLAATTSLYSAVAMIYLPGGRSLCTGTVVSPRAVLTAAHCALREGKYTVVTDFGTFSTYTHPYTGVGDVNATDDLALLVFDTAIVEGSNTSDRIYGIADSVHSGDLVRLVGYGCNDIDAKTGAGVKRTGTNHINSISDYIYFKTPYATSSRIRGILGPDDMSGSCFGDSGGPALAEKNGDYEVVGVTHAGGQLDGYLISEYIDLTSNANRHWLVSMNSAYNLGIKGL